MNLSGLFLRQTLRACTIYHRSFGATTFRAATTKGDAGAAKSPPTIAQQIDVLYSEQPPIPEYRAREGEPVNVKLARLLYQSRKRGMLENGLLLSSFANRYLDKLDEKQLDTYDHLINLPTNDWDIYYWISGLRPPPAEFQSDVMTMLQNFVQNEEKESRVRQPDLKEPQSDN